MHEFVQQLTNELQANADANRAPGAKAYMKNQFEFFGLPMNDRRRICKRLIKEYPVAITGELNKVVKQLWLLPQREYQYCAIELLTNNKKLWNEQIIHLFEYCITHKSWWDTVDFIAAECTGPYFKLYPTKVSTVTAAWNTSDNIWLQRSSLLFQLKYKHATNVELLSGYILHLTGSREFFVQKAIGWILREYAKTNPTWVQQFVQQHTLSPLSRREALKHVGAG